MSKELEALKRIRQETCPATYMADFDKNECCDIIEQALQRLETIDNANPSEALEILEEISKEEVLFKSRNTIYMGGEKSNSFTHKDTIGNYFKGIDTIKQALLKAQEQEKENELLKEIIKRY